MADDGQGAKIAEFSAVTGVDSDRAKFFLESSNWQISIALDQFYSGDADVAFEDASEDMPEEVPMVADPPPPSQPQPTKKKSGSRFATMSDMMKDEPDNDSDEEGQAYYAGGSDRGSGQQVVGPRKKKEDSMVSSLFKQAKEHGAEEVSSGAPVAGSSRNSSSIAFRGSGYRLGDNVDTPTNPVPGTAGSMPDKPPEQKHVVLKLWKNGFSLDDGELRDYKDPNNAKLLNSISQGEIPMELVREAKGGEVSLDMEDHREEEYVRPKPKLKAFSGQGYMLGSPTPNVAGAPSSASTSSASAGGSSAADSKANEKSAQESIGVDSSQPVTSVQLRLGDGTRLVGKFNQTHTVGDIRRYISLARPASSGRTYILMTTFPNKELTDESQSIADAKLLNAVIVQRFK